MVTMVATGPAPTFDPMTSGSPGDTLFIRACKAGLTQSGWTYDTALPQDWVDLVRDRTGISPVGIGVVWLYGPSGSAYWSGGPYALTPEAHVLVTWARSLGLA